jgi:hypothetical protein
MFVIPQFSFPYRASLVTGPGGMVLLALLVGLIVHAILAMLFCYACAFVAAGALMAADRAFKWDADFQFKGLFATLTNAFVAFVLVTWAVDFIAQSYLSPPMMIIALGRQACWPNCVLTPPGADLMVTSVPSYYAYAAGPGPLSALRYLALAVPGTVAIAATLRLAHPSMFTHGIAVPFPGRPGVYRSTRQYAQVFAGPGGPRVLIIATTICIVIALFVVTPLYMQLLFAWASTVV